MFFLLKDPEEVSRNTSAATISRSPRCVMCVIGSKPITKNQGAFPIESNVILIKKLIKHIELPDLRIELGISYSQRWHRSTRP